VRGEAPVIVRGPYQMKRPYRSFPPRIDRDWLQILFRIPVGWGLRVPLSQNTVTIALGHLTEKGLIQRFEYVTNRTNAGWCNIYHIRPLGKPFPMKLPSRLQRSEEYWDRLFRRVRSGETVTVNASYMVVYQAFYRRVLHGSVSPRSIRFEKTQRHGKEVLRLRKR